ncbi:hypothetical protein BE15_02660 [Sorangium cellulosum]|uniref:Uncharacterized protein n=1 Tax=Sorangium cellulosum TaxID=56 RepID=A0A150QYR2_SORCE|nr:hypothetical protein BE15_02660 [Sorangium cellulosum]
MGRDDEGGVLAARDGDRDRRRQVALGAAAVDHLADGADVDGVALELLDERLFELGGADGFEQLQEPGDRAADVVAALGDDAEECLAAAGGASEAIEAAPATVPSVPSLSAGMAMECTPLQRWSSRIDRG